MLTTIRRIYSFAGVYGIICMLPQYFMETKTGLDYPPAINHPEYYYGFIGVTLAFQIVFLLIGRDPVRYKPLMIAAILEKLSFGIAAPLLFMMGRAPSIIAFFACIDLLLMLLFIFSWLKTPDYVADRNGTEAFAQVS